MVSDHDSLIDVVMHDRRQQCTGANIEKMAARFNNARQYIRIAEKPRSCESEAGVHTSQGS